MTNYKLKIYLFQSTSIYRIYVACSCIIDSIFNQSFGHTKLTNIQHHWIFVTEYIMNIHKFIWYKRKFLLHSKNKFRRSPYWNSPNPGEVNSRDMQYVIKYAPNSDYCHSLINNISDKGGKALAPNRQWDNIPEIIQSKLKEIIVAFVLFNYAVRLFSESR